jgi:hypothetical protein
MQEMHDVGTGNWNKFTGNLGYGSGNVHRRRRFPFLVDVIRLAGGRVCLNASLNGVRVKVASFCSPPPFLPHFTRPGRAERTTTI